MVLNDAAVVANSVWRELPERYIDTDVDVFQVMPNHFHGIIKIQKSVGAGLSRPQVCDVVFGREDRAPALTLGNVVAYYKYEATKRINALRQIKIAKVWQRNYYEHIIRNEDDLFEIRQYIANNPLKWEMDRHFVHADAVQRCM